MAKADKRYGMVVGSFQPFHIGHMYLINKVIDAGLTPIIVIQEAPLESRVFSQAEIMDLIMDSYHGYKILFLKTTVLFKESDLEDWVDRFLLHVSRVTGGIMYRNITLFTSIEMDPTYRRDYRGVTAHTFSDILRREGIVVKDVPPYEDPITRELVESVEIRRLGMEEFQCNVSKAVRQKYNEKKEWVDE